MKKFTVQLCFLILSTTLVYGQTSPDLITIKKTFGGYQFWHGETRLNVSQLTEIMRPNELAYQQMKSAQSTFTMASVIGVVGGFMIGWPIGTAIGGGDPNWAMAGIGAGLVVVSIPVTRSFNKKAMQAVDTFNSGLLTNSLQKKIDVNLSLIGYNAGLTIRF